MSALGEIFEAARAIMGWLGDCAKVYFCFKFWTVKFDQKSFFEYGILIIEILQIIASENQPVRWTTPLGLPVVQPYFKTERHVVSI